MAAETSIIIRTLNESRHLEKLMKGIHDQNYQDWEIILVDSGSSDGTLEIAEKYGAKIHHIPQKEFTFGRSLNLGCRVAEGKYLVFASGHVWPVSNNWLKNLVKPFEEPSIAMVYGRQRATADNRLSEQQDLQMLYGPVSSILVDDPQGNNGNAAVRKDLWQTQPFDEGLTGLEDVDWARKAQRKDGRIYYAADAVVYHVHQESLGQVYRRYFREASAYKEMFPGHTSSLLSGIKGFSYLVIRDYLYALRTRKFGKMLQIPGSRLAQTAGVHKGLRHNRKLPEKMVKSTEATDTFPQVVVDGPDQHHLREADAPHLKPDELLIKVAYVGVCATDLEVAAGTLEYYRTGRAQYPIVPGHEYSGVVVTSGSQVKDFRVGQKVVGECAVGCGACSDCRAGEFYRCTTREEVGVINRNGAYSRYMSIPASYAHKLPEEIPLKYAALVEPTAVCLKGLSKLGPSLSGYACIVGAGSLGNLCAQVLKARGLHVTVVDPDESRLKLLQKYDIDTLTELGPLDRFTYLIEVSGNERSIPPLIEESAPSSKILLLGLPYTEAVPITFSTVTSYDKVIIGSVASRREDWDEAIKLIQKGQINLDDHTATVEPLSNYLEAWSATRTRQQLKVLLQVSEGLEGF